jgi:hypothetical protein
MRRLGDFVPTSREFTTRREYPSGLSPSPCWRLEKALFRNYREIG